MQILTGFHAAEEKIRSVYGNDTAASKITVFYSNPGPRVKKILQQAKENSVKCCSVDKAALDKMVASLPAAARDHRGIVVQVEGEKKASRNIIDFDIWLNGLKQKEPARNLVIVLDSVTDPHNVGAIIRSADQFGASLVLLPERNSANNISDNDIIARSSAGASAWVPVSIVTNLVRAVKQLKDAGFWVYGADAGGASVAETTFAENTVLVMGSEGSGIGRLLEEQCDSIVSIPTCGRIDSLNVSVAAGVLMYEAYRQNLASAR